MRKPIERNGKSIRSCAVVAVWLTMALSAPALASDPPTVWTSSLGPEYVLGVEDRLFVSVWKEPALTLRVVIRPDGRISLPLLGEMTAAGKTPERLAAEIREGLAEYIRTPLVTIVVEEILSYKVYIIGKVLTPGVFQFKRRTRVVQALAQAGGFTEFANRSGIVVFRPAGDREIRIPVDYKKIVSGQNPEMNIYLEPGDTIIVD